jgi:hypothetical protein
LPEYRAYVESQQGRMFVVDPDGPVSQPPADDWFNFHQIPCESNGKWVGVLWNRDAKGEVSPQVGKQQAAHAEFAKRFAEGGDLALLTKEEAAERQKAFGAEWGC